MPIKVYKVADIIDPEIVFSSSAQKTVPGVTRIKAFRQPTFEVFARCALFELYPPADPTERYSLYDEYLPNLNRYLSESSYLGVDPVLLPSFTWSPGEKPTQLVYFRDRLFMLERVARASERAEVVLRVKKAVYDEEAELSTLRDAVANLESAIEFQRLGPKRNPIPEDVKLLVWARDGGRCVRCGSEQELHFDHIIPVAKGGGNIAANIQILCQTCNLRKADRIAMP